MDRFVCLSQYLVVLVHKNKTVFFDVSLSSLHHLKTLVYLVWDRISLMHCFQWFSCLYLHLLIGLYRIIGFAPAFSFYLGSEDLNSSFQTCMADTLLTKPSPQLRDLFLLSFHDYPSGEDKGESGLLIFSAWNSIPHSGRLGGWGISVGSREEEIPKEQ